MKWLTILVLAIAIAAAIVARLSFSSGRAEDQAAPIFGVKIPSVWQSIAVSHGTGLDELRGILGSDVTVQANRKGMPPFPDARSS
jgi:hypothetical protein